MGTFQILVHDSQGSVINNTKTIIEDTCERQSWKHSKKERKIPLSPPVSSYAYAFLSLHEPPHARHFHPKSLPTEAASVSVAVRGLLVALMDMPRWLVRLDAAHDGNNGKKKILGLRQWRQFDEGQFFA